MGAPFRVLQNTSAVYTVTLVDENAVPIALASVTAMKLTLFNSSIPEPSTPTDNIINSRNLQNVLNANNVTMHATSGLVTWEIQKLDNVMIDESLDSEIHTARFDVEYGSPTKYASHEVRLRVVNLRKLGSS